MASSRQIEHLERRHKENPEGLTFAPLANAYRNTGQPERAIEILMLGLEHHPNHAPARIVLGRCHLDMGEDRAAEEAFSKVLQLDRENVVALKALADIGERGGRLADAESWLTQLLDVDRNNDEAREQLERIRAAASAGPGDEAVGTADEEAADGGAVDDHPAGFEAGAAFEADISPATEAADPGPLAGEDSAPAERSPWEPPAVAEDVVAAEATDLESDGPGGPQEPEAPEAVEEAEPVHWFDRENPAPGAGEGDAIDFDMAIEVDETIELRPSEQNEYQQPSASESLGLRGSTGNEFQVPDVDDLDLHPSESNVYQTPSDSETLGLSGDDALEPIGLDEPTWGEPDRDMADTVADETDTAESPEPVADPLSSWFAPAPDEPVAQDLPADTAEGLSHETPATTEPDVAAFEESALAPPSTWGPALDAPVTPTADEPEAAAPVEGDEPEEAAAMPWAESTPWGGAPDLSDATAGEPEVDVPAVPEAAEEEESEAVGEGADEGLMATETMAEVYLSQGHRFEALQVYRVLAAETPDDIRLQEKVTALEGELASVDAVAAPEAPESAVPDAGAVPEAGSEGGTSVRDLFQGLLAAQPAIPESQAVPASGKPPQSGSGNQVTGEPTRPAQDPLSLSAVFGEDASPVPPAVRGGGEEKSEGFSFDSFFGQARGTGRARSAARARRGEDEEDLDQFHSWLQGLKG